MLTLQNSDQQKTLTGCRKHTTLTLTIMIIAFKTVAVIYLCSFYQQLKRQLDN